MPRQAEQPDRRHLTKAAMDISTLELTDFFQESL